MAGEAAFVCRLFDSEARAANHWIAGAGACKALKAEVTAAVIRVPEYALPIRLHPAFHTLKTTIAMAPRGLLSCQCAFYLCRRACCRRNSRSAICTRGHCGRRESYAPNRAKVD